MGFRTCPCFTGRSSCPAASGDEPILSDAQAQKKSASKLPSWIFICSPKSKKRKKEAPLKSIFSDLSGKKLNTFLIYDQEENTPTNPTCNWTHGISTMLEFTIGHTLHLKGPHKSYATLKNSSSTKFMATFITEVLLSHLSVVTLGLWLQTERSIYSICNIDQLLLSMTIWHSDTKINFSCLITSSWWRKS